MNWFQQGNLIMKLILLVLVLPGIVIWVICKIQSIWEKVNIPFIEHAQQAARIKELETALETIQKMYKSANRITGSGQWEKMDIRCILGAVFDKEKKG